jgi:DNA-directed RNA polymerase II subunit RPB1
MLRYGITDETPVRPKRLRFGLLSAAEIERMSVCEVTETTLYYRGLPASGGLLDGKMGTVDRRHLCATCMRDTLTCQGHAGHIKLPYPVYHVGYIETVLKTLRTVCFFCTRVCSTEGAESDEQGRAQFATAHAAFKTKKFCPHCGMVRPTYTRTPYGVKIQWPADAQWETEEEEAYCTAPFTAREALSILSHISDADIGALGFDVSSHPANMIIQNLVVPPPCTRPAIYASEGSRSRGQNELTVRLLEVLKRAHELRNFMGDAEDVVVTPEFLERLNRLQYEVFVLVQSNLRIPKPAGMGRSGVNNTIKSLGDRLKGKEGRVRGNLLGKRVDFSARCVITPDAYFECDCIGVPFHIATSLTIPETVNATNFDALAGRVRRGANTVLGAETLIRTTGEVIHLATCKQREALEVRHGDVVERYLADDDVVVFNRQPSLHMHGMQAHRVRLMPGYTFRLSLVVAAPYNADFDGDEMNVHVPQSKAASAECTALMSVGQNTISSQANRPVMGIVQDSLLGVFLMTQPDMLIGYAHACRIIGATRHAPRALPAAAAVHRRGDGTQRWWTGKQLLSVLFPRGLNVEPDDVRLEDLPVVVRDGQLLCGTLRKAHMGTSAGGIIDVISRDYGGSATMRFMADVQRETHTFLMQQGHHVGIDDVMLSSEGQRRVDERLHKATHLCEEIQREVVDAPVEVVAKAESAILRLLSKMLLQTGGIVNEHMSERNAIRRMVTAGSKGSFINLSQICATLGQQSLEGQRITSTKDQRTLPFFSRNDLSLAARGMVYNSFALGLSPTELFYHSVGGREGLVDTSVKTSQTGYIQRRMNKAMEDHTVRPDGTVRNACDHVISFSWGSDGFHPARLERVKLATLGRTSDDALMEEARVAIRRTKTTVLQTDLDNRVLLPFHPERMRRRLRNASAGALDVAAARARVESMCAGLPCVAVYALLGLFSRETLEQTDESTFEGVLRDIAARIETARGTCHESAGCIAAQSVGEPCTQLTLNTFHTAGVATKNVTMGVPRFKECLDASRSPKTPCTTIRFKPEFALRQVAAYMANTLPLTRLGDIVTQSTVVFDPDQSKTVVEADAWMVHACHALEGAVEDASRYVVRLEMLQSLMRSRELTPPIVRRNLIERLRGRAIVTSSEVNAVEWVVRIRFLEVRSMVEAGGLSDDQEAILNHRAANALMETVVVGGHPSVSSASAAEATRLDTGETEHVVHAFGTVLADAVASPCVDWTRCTSNDIWEVYNTLGVEACVHVLFDQIKGVISFDGTYVDDRHIMLIVDTMCRNGAIMPLNRHGINRTDSSPLMRCSFEETIDVLSAAALFGEEENARGCTTSIMTGQLAHMGTGNVRVLFPARDVQNEAPIALKGRVLRSTCRSYTSVPEHEALEYVFHDVRPVVPRALSPPSVRKRARFRSVSPTH